MERTMPKNSNISENSESENMVLSNHSSSHHDFNMKQNSNSDSKSLLPHGSQLTAKMNPTSSGKSKNIIQPSYSICGHDVIQTAVSIASPNTSGTSESTTTGASDTIIVSNTNTAAIPNLSAEPDWFFQNENENDLSTTKKINLSNSTTPYAMQSLSSQSTLGSVSGSSNAHNSSSHLLLRHPDAIPTLISLLSKPNREVHEQAMWILGTIAAGEGAAPSMPNPSSLSLTNFANANNMSIPNTLPSLTNASKSSQNPPSSVAQAREQVLLAGAMEAILACLEANPHKISLQRIGSWTLSNLVDVQYPHPSTKNPNSNINNNNNSNNTSISSNASHALDINIRALLPTLKRLLYTADAEVLSHTCWALSHLCDGPSSHISVVVSPSGGIVPRLVELLLHPSWRVTKPALRTIGNVVCAECVDDSSHSGDNQLALLNSNITSSSAGNMVPVDYTETILECGAVPKLKQLITHGNREIQKEACWTLSNIAAGAVDQIQTVIDSGAIAPLVKLASDPNADQEVRSEACWVVLNATSCGSDAQIEVLVKEGCVSVLGVLLGEQSMVMMALEGLERVLQVEESKEIQRKSLHDIDKLKFDRVNNDVSEATSVVSASLIEALKQHKNSAVSKRAVKIWKQHFVSCALCLQSFSRHRTSEAHFCKECKCHVCKNCDCEIYHLSYQEQIWAATEEKSQAKSMAKKSKKNKKKMKKKKQKKQSSLDQTDSIQKQGKNKEDKANEPYRDQKVNPDGDICLRSRSSTMTTFSESEPGYDHNHNGQIRPPINELEVLDEKNQLSKQIQLQQPSKDNSLLQQNVHVIQQTNEINDEIKDTKNIFSNDNSVSLTESNDNDYEVLLTTNFVLSNNTKVTKEKNYSDIDLVHYLQQTGSIIALSRLLDQLDGDYSFSNLNDDEERLDNLKLDGDSRILKHENHIVTHRTKA